MPQLNYNREMFVGRAGDPADSGFTDDISLINDDPRTAQVATYTVDTATNATAYAIEIDGVSCTFTSDASATKAEIATGLTAAINTEPLINARVASVAGDPDFVVTAKTAGIGFTATESDSLLSLVQTTADDDADLIPFGTLIVCDGTDDELGRAVDDANMTAQVITLTPAAVNAAIYTIGVTVNGVTYQAAYTADGSATVKEILDAMTPILNGLLPANSVIVTDDDSIMTLTAEVAGLSFSVAAGSTAATATWTVTDTASRITDVNRAARGVALRTAAVEGTNTTTQYGAGSVMSVRRQGRVRVTTQESIDITDDVYVGVGTGVEGLWTGSATTGYLKLDSSKFQWSKNLSATLAVLQVNL